MSRGKVTAMRNIVLAAALLLPLGGCAYDYMQHTDRIGYSAGDAVRANLESETINPSRRSMYDTTGLGRNGSVMPAAPTAAAATN